VVNPKRKGDLGGVAFKKDLMKALSTPIVPQDQTNAYGSFVVENLSEGAGLIPPPPA
jgi:hypothetical protein